MYCTSPVVEQQGVGFRNFRCVYPQPDGCRTRNGNLCCGTGYELASGLAGVTSTPLSEKPLAHFCPLVNIGFVGPEATQGDRFVSVTVLLLGEALQGSDLCPHSRACLPLVWGCARLSLGWGGRTSSRDSARFSEQLSVEEPKLSVLVMGLCHPHGVHSFALGLESGMQKKAVLSWKDSSSAASCVLLVAMLEVMQVC